MRIWIRTVANESFVGFCMARIVTTILRIASVSLPANLRLAIAAQIFVAAGVVLVFVINLFWAQRIVRALHPRIGWHPAFTVLVKVLIVLIIVTLAILITATVQSFYTLRPRTRKIDRDLQIYGTFFLAIISFLPIPIVLLSFIYGSHLEFRSEALEDGFIVKFALPRVISPEKFGYGRIRTKALVLLAGSALLCLGSSFRCATLWLPPVPRSQPLPPYFSKACFYIFNFVIEVLVVYLYAFMRVDLRFHVPDGSHGTYVLQQPLAGSQSDVETGAAGDYEKTNNAADAVGNPSSSVSDSEKTALPPITPTSTRAMPPTMDTPTGANTTTATEALQKKASRDSVLGI
jgi:hypothetical protein